MQVGAAEFKTLMAIGGPFEASPHVAVGVSGGLDSMALCLLLDRWARERGGRVTALTVDHGLRPESTSESTVVGGWLGARGIAHAVLGWSGAKPTRGIQAAAREARHALLGDWCQRAGVLHLALAHHRDDQAETFLQRLGRGSGVAGLSAMSPLTVRAFGRLLRPLLDIPRERLAATLADFAQPWIEDPSNHDPAYGRVRVRATLLPGLAAEGITRDRLAHTAMRLGRAREALEEQATALVARAVDVDPMGFAWVDAAALAAAPAEIGLRVLARLLAAIGGAAYPPRHARLERLYTALATDSLGGGCTLGGCRIGPYRGRLLVCREAAGIAGRVAVLPSDRVRWDRRFLIRTGASLPEGCFVAALGEKGWAAVAAASQQKPHTAVPQPVRATLPALFFMEEVLAVPHLSYSQRGEERGAVAFSPDISLTYLGRPLASWRWSVIC